jgi:hypothetical protein
MEDSIPLRLRVALAGAFVFALACSALFATACG